MTPEEIYSSSIAQTAAIGADVVSAGRADSNIARGEHAIALKVMIERELIEFSQKWEIDVPEPV